MRATHIRAPLCTALLVVIGATCCWALGPTAPNLAPNPSLEDAAAANTPRGWQASGAAEWSTAAPLEGTRCLLVRGGPDSRWVADPAPCSPGDAFLFSGWLRTSAGPAYFAPEYYLDVEFLDAAGQAIPRPRDVLRPVYRVTPGWFFFQSPFFSAPPGAASLRLVLREPRTDQVTEADRLSLWRVTGPFPRLQGVYPWNDLMEAVAQTYRDQAPPTFPATPRPPASVLARVVSSFSGNVFFEPTPAGGLRLRVMELFGRPVPVTGDWTLTDWRGHEVARGSLPATTLAAHEVREIPLPVPPLPLRGTYLLLFSLQGEGQTLASGYGRLALAPRFSRQAGVVPQSPWGMYLGSHPLAYYPPRDAIATRMAQLAGVRWCTVTPWLEIPLHDAASKAAMGAPGVYEEILDLYLSHGIAVRAYLASYYLPDRPLTPADLDPFRKWVAHIVNRLKGRVQLWYYGGEPQQAWIGAWGPNAPTPPQFFQQMQAARRVFQELDPTVPSATPTFAHYGGAEPLRWAYDQMGVTGADFDLLQYNPYESAEGIGRDFVEILRAHGDDNKGLVIGEIGIWADRNPPSELLQAEYLVRKQLHILAVLPQMKQINWFCFPAGPEGGGGMGVIEYEDSTPKPQWQSYAVMTDQLGEVPRLAGSQEKNGAVCYTWATPRGPLATVWSQGHPGAVRLQVTGGPVTLVDLMGNESPAKVQGGVLALDLTSRPVYLRGAGQVKLADFTVAAPWRNPSPPAPQAAGAPAPLRQEGLEIVPGPFGPAAHFTQDGATVLYPVDNDLCWWKQGTLELWFRPDLPLLDYHNRYLLNLRPVADTPYTIGPGSEIIGGSTYLHFWVDGGFISAGFGSSVDRFVMFPQRREWPAGGWHQVVLTWTESEARLYLDGELAKTEQITPLSPFDASRLSVGSFQPAQEALRGSISGLRTYSRVKPLEEIRRDFTAGTQGRPPSHAGLLWEMRLQQTP